MKVFWSISGLKFYTFNCKKKCNFAVGTLDDMHKKRKIAITGATGVMGQATLRELAERLDRFEIKLLARRSRKNERKLKPYLRREGIETVWGDLTDYSDVERLVSDADIVLHIGGMVSPLADHYPEKALKTNVTAARNIVDVIKKMPASEQPALVYIGSVAQISDRAEPFHWARTGDPVMVSVFDYYGVSKVLAERIVAESGLRRWVSLRQSGILHPGLFAKSSDPITFHVPLRGVLEWATAEDSGRLMANICEERVPDKFWNNFYNIGSGKSYRLTNYEFEKLILSAVGTPAPEKIFEPSWFATRNFHGCWYLDSDKLESRVPFRANVPVEKYFDMMVKKAPWWTRLAPLAPAPLVKRMMRRVAMTPGLGTLDWERRNDCEQQITAFFGSRERRRQIGAWNQTDLSRPSEEPVVLNHGYDESKPEAELSLNDMKEAAAFRGGECLAETMVPGDLERPLEWKCAFGHRFTATPKTVLKGGHWCPRCLPAPWTYDAEARKNKFLAQVWYASHDPEEDMVYDDGKEIRHEYSR